MWKLILTSCQTAPVLILYNNVKVSFIVYKLISEAPVALYKQPTYNFLYNNTIKYTIAKSLPLLNKKNRVAMKGLFIWFLLYVFVCYAIGSSGMKNLHFLNVKYHFLICF